MQAGQGRGKGKRSMRRDRENQAEPACLRALGPDMDPVRVSPYRPAALTMPHREAGHTTAPDRMTQTQPKKLLASREASTHGSGAGATDGGMQYKANGNRCVNPVARLREREKRRQRTGLLRESPSPRLRGEGWVRGQRPGGRRNTPLPLSGYRPDRWVTVLVLRSVSLRLTRSCETGAGTSRFPPRSRCRDCGRRPICAIRRAAARSSASCDRRP